MAEVAGLDEAGRGALAGPVVAAAVILAPERPIEGLDDSKRLGPRRREALCALIRERARAWAVVAVEPREIDRINILQASLQAMARAVQQLHVRPDCCLADGNQCPPLPMPVRAVVGGDGLHPEIMAASILAKVHRDRLMCALDEQHPGYGFAAHKGYPTAAHRAALRALGPSPVHRLSYAPVAQCALPLRGAT